MSKKVYALRDVQVFTSLAPNGGWQAELALGDTIRSLTPTETGQLGAQLINLALDLTTRAVPPFPPPEPIELIHTTPVIELTGGLRVRAQLRSGLWHWQTLNESGEWEDFAPYAKQLCRNASDFERCAALLRPR